MAFDLASYRAAQQPWVTTLDGHQFVARHVSAAHVQRHYRAAATKDPAVMARSLRWLLRKAFPWRPSYIWRGDPVRLLLERLSPRDRLEALTDFFGSLAPGRGMPTPGQTTRGNSSPR